MSEGDVAEEPFQHVGMHSGDELAMLSRLTTFSTGGRAHSFAWLPC